MGDYICDFSIKLNDEIEVDVRGVPINRLYNGASTYFAIGICQKLIGLLQSDCSVHECSPLVNWLNTNIDENNSIKTWQHLGDRVTSPYSAMTQGQALSALVRYVEKVGGCPTTEDSINRLCDGYLDATNLGFASTNHPFVLLETPRADKSVILNGWCFALWGGLEAGLFTHRQDIKHFSEQSLAQLAQSLPNYSSKRWSYYDDKGKIASLFYHNLHITLLHALYTYDGDERFLRSSQEFADQKTSRVNRTLALIAKAKQKITEAPYPEFSR